MERSRPVGDTEGVGHPSSVALGFCRLAILDLSPLGDQPLIVPHRAAMAFNGEIYNYVEIRRELQALGWTFASTGDSEVLLKAYLQWGVDSLERLDGMWAFAIYDERAKSLLLSRDRFGEKPLFWTAWRGGVAFASEVKQLMRFPGVDSTLDAAEAARYLATGRPYSGSSSWFVGIGQLDPGEWMRVDQDGQRRGRYHDLEGEVRAIPQEGSASDWADRFGAAMAGSVERRLRSDVLVGTSLSSGLDSSLVLAEATSQGHTGYRAFTLGSEDPKVDESEPARRFAESMQAVWHRVRADAADFSSIWDRMTWHHESPISSTSIYGQWKVFEAARAAGVTVILDGQGADEVLGGYNKFIASILWETAKTRPHRLAGPIKGFMRQVGSFDTLRTAGNDYLGRLGDQPPLTWLRGGSFDGRMAPRVRIGPYRQRLDDIAQWSLPNLLSYADRNSMAHSVEVRLPYLDHSLVALGLATPHDVLFRDGWTKWPLRKTLASRGGATTAWAPGKMWFGVPQQDWLRDALTPQVSDWLTAPHPGWESVADPVELKRFQQSWQGRSPSFAWDDQVFKMVAFDRFLRVWFPS